MAERPSRLIGINHVALEVVDLDEALKLYGRLFDFEIRGRVPGMAFIDIGDQFLAISEGRSQPEDDGRHFGLVVEDRHAVTAAAEREGLEIRRGRRGDDFVDPWGNRFQPVTYADVQFERTAGVKRRLGIEDVEKSESAKAEIREGGLE